MRCFASLAARSSGCHGCVGRAEWTWRPSGHRGPSREVGSAADRRADAPRSPGNAARDAGFRIVLCLFVAAWCLASAASARAQQAFSVPKLSLRAFVQSDSSVGLLYDITLHNGRAAPLGMVRVVTPRRVDLGRIVASLDGTGITDLRLPLYGEPGFEVWLGRRALPPGKHGRLRLEFTVEREVLADAERDGYARLEIAPTSFDEPADNDPTDVTVVAHLPPGVQGEEVVVPPDIAAELGQFDGRTTATWRFRSARLGDLEPVSVSFPARGMTQLVRRTWLESAARWLRRSVPLRICAAAGSLLLFAFAFLRWTGRRQVAAAIVVAAMLGGLFARSPASQLVAIPLLIVLAAAVEFRRWRRWRAARGARRSSPASGAN